MWLSSTISSTSALPPIRSASARAACFRRAAAPRSAGWSLLFGSLALVLACFVGYYVVWSVTPALHTPLMAVTNAISSVIIVGALIAVGASAGGFSQWMGFLAVILASINIFGGFAVTSRMLEMFKREDAA